VTLFGGLLGLGAHGGYHAVMTWLPTFLKTERNLSVLNSGGYLAVIIFAFWCGCVVSGFLIDRIGRRKNIVLFALCCVVTVQCYVFLPLTNTQMLFLGFPLGFFAAGIPASLGALFNELYPADVRGAGVGFCYNFGRVLSAVFPFLVGHMSDSMSLGVCNWHRRRGRLRCGGDRGTLPAGNPWAQSRGLDCTGANHGRRQRDRPGLMTIPSIDEIHA
jgi:MFS family permease